MRALPLAFLFVLALPGMSAGAGEQASSETPEFTAERPGFTPATGTVPRGYVQFESGFELESVTRPDLAAHTFEGGAPLLRFGLSRYAEFRVGGGSYTSGESRGPSGVERVHGIGDFGVSVKVALRRDDGWRPALALLSSLSIPSRHAYFSSGSYDPGLVLAWSKEVGRGFAVGGGVGAASLSATGGRMVQTFWSVAVSRTMGPVGTVTGEYYRLSQGERGGAPTRGVAASLARGIGRNAQVDVGAGRTVSGPASGWVLSAGFAVRNPLAPLGWFRH